ncbi:TRAP transporter substrate-binding protein DctP [Breznakiella homolactica]|uniref:TRAP transporter substrate-binding protein DctP n=1 Tax=Breznakiella homolactica TaxID=2798577 RepID=A0A7T7XLL2_9SPIR|nr:TRAP transporter substrate-binding protein DctP [Breznakiella homolactica]QQO08560.1 TRAP transporter substrate-binding protein DctP [Breznakiella homolactica]
MKPGKKILMILLLAVLLTPMAAFSQRRQVLKIASIAPENTPYGEFLNRMAREWRDATNGEVEVRIYHNGVAGNEDDVLRKLKLNQLQGGVFTSLGLNAITPEVMALSCPFFIRDNDEMNLVMSNLRGDFEEKIGDKGFVPVAWTNAGWVKLFSKTPVFVPSDLKSQKLGTSASEPELTQAFKTLGYNMIPINMNELLMALNSGMVDAIYQSPMMVAGLQIFTIAKNMASINIAPVVGSVVLNRNAWRSIPDKYKPRLMEINRQLERDFGSSIAKLEDDAVATMKSYGLVVNTINPDQLKLWYDDIDRTLPSLVGTTFDRETFGKVDAILKAYRAGR